MSLPGCSTNSLLKMDNSRLIIVEKYHPLHVAWGDKLISPPLGPIKLLTVYLAASGNDEVCYCVNRSEVRKCTL